MSYGDGIRVAMEALSTIEKEERRAEVQAAVRRITDYSDGDVGHREVAVALGWHVGKQSDAIIQALGPRGRLLSRERVDLLNLVADGSIRIHRDRPRDRNGEKAYKAVTTPGLFLGIIERAANASRLTGLDRRLVSKLDNVAAVAFELWAQHVEVFVEHRSLGPGEEHQFGNLPRTQADGFRLLTSVIDMTSSLPLAILYQANHTDPLEWTSLSNPLGEPDFVQHSSLAPALQHISASYNRLKLRIEKLQTK